MNRKMYDVASGEWGAAGEAALRQYFVSHGYKAVKHPNGIYGEDIEYVSSRERFYVDAERRTERTWSGSGWMSWPTLHVLARRTVSEDTLFITLAANMRKAYVSFPLDLMCVRPVPMDNIHASGEQIRDHEIMRCLPLDLTLPIVGSIAEMNANRVRKIVSESESYLEITRALRGREPFGFGAPYGIDDEEWRAMQLDVEDRSGLRELASFKKSDTTQKRFF